MCVTGWGVECVWEGVGVSVCGRGWGECIII